jgi:hypothetical protein
MTTHPTEAAEMRLICSVDNSEHRIGQNYDERRGTGNGPQICLKCKKTLQQLVAEHDAAQCSRITAEVVEARIDELGNLIEGKHWNTSVKVWEIKDRIATLRKSEKGKGK